MANGNVNVFNVFSETMTSLSPNGLSAGTINGWDRSTYVPGVLKVPRTLNSSDAPGKFFNGKNGVIINWPSGLYSFQITISGADFPITADLLLYISRNVWTLYDMSGVDRMHGEVKAGPSLAKVEAGKEYEGAGGR